MNASNDARAPGPGRRRLWLIAVLGFVLVVAVAFFTIRQRAVPAQAAEDCEATPPPTEFQVAECEGGTDSVKPTPVPGR